MDNKDARRPEVSNAAPLAEQNDALGFYLDSLLMDLPEEVPKQEQVPEGAQEELQAGTVNVDVLTAIEPDGDDGGKLTPQRAGATNSAGFEVALSAGASPQSSEPLRSSQHTPTPQKPAADTPEIPRVPVSRHRAEADSAMPLEVGRDELPRRPFAEPPGSQPLLAAPPVLPLLMRDALDTATQPVVAKIARKPCTPPPAPVTETRPVSIEAAPDNGAAVSEVPSELSAKVPVEAQSRVRATVPAETPPDAVQNEVPDWAQNRFQCLSFMVAGLTLAAPLEKLHGIVEWQAEITELPGYASWFVGLLQNRGENVRVIDTAQIIMPDGRRPDARPVRERIKYVVLIDDGRWGLAVDSIGQVLTLEADGVRWRGGRSKRPWLAGTAVEQMCAVLDMDSLSEQLVRGLKLDD